MGAFLLLLPLGQPQAHAYTHPCVPLTQNELNTLKASINQEPWKTGYKILANTSTSQLTWPMEGPFATVTRNPNLNLTAWSDDMSAVKNCAMMWVLTGSNAYAQKAHDILIAYALVIGFGDEADAQRVGAEPIKPVQRQPGHPHPVRQDAPNRVRVQRGVADAVAGADFPK